MDSARSIVKSIQPIIFDDSQPIDSKSVRAAAAMIPFTGKLKDDDYQMVDEEAGIAQKPKK